MVDTSVWSQFIATCANYAELEDTLLKEEHAPLISLLLPLVCMIMIHAYMAELVEDGCYGRLPSPKDLQVVLIDHRR